MKKAKILGAALLPALALGLLLTNVASAQDNGQNDNNQGGQDGNRGGMMWGRPGGPNQNPGGPMMGPGVGGTVTAVSGNIITITSQRKGWDGEGKNSTTTNTTTTYTIDATNATITKDNATSTISAVLVGDMVRARGTLTGTNLVATSVYDGKVMPMGPGGNGKGKGEGRGKGVGGGPLGNQTIVQGNGQPIVGGNVTGITGSTLTITNAGNTTYTVDATSATIVKGNATSSVSNITVGDKVIVQGAINGSSVTASSVIDQGNASSTPAHGGMGGGIFGAIRGFFHNLFGF